MNQPAEPTSRTFPVHRTLYLHERAERLSDLPPLTDGERRRAEAAVESWKETMLVSDELFRQRLAAAGLDRETFGRLITVDVPPDVEPPESEWTEIAREILTDPFPDEPLPALLADPDATGDETRDSVAFVGFLRPVLRSALRRFRRGVASLLDDRDETGPLFSPRAEAQLVDLLANRVAGCCAPTLILELNIARLDGILEGDDEKARFAFYSQELLGREEHRRALFDEYLGLARVLSIHVELWIDAMLELAERFLDDRAEIHRRFAPDLGPSPIHGARASLSDPHRGGRGVVCLELAPDRWVVYKPRSLKVDTRFQALLAWLEENGLSHPLRRLAVIDRGTYGWVEFVHAEGCDEERAVERYFHRLGTQLALLQVLRAVDFHYENLIAAGEQPVLIDLESVFHLPARDLSSAPAREQARQRLDESVLGIGILPVLTWSQDGRAGVDMSGIGGRGGEDYPHPMLAPVARNTDRMRLERRNVAMKEAQNRCRLNGEPVDAARYTGSLIAGYREAHELMQRHRGELEAELEGWRDVELRYIVRPTAIYGLFLQEGVHPDNLRHPLDRDRLLDKLWAHAEVRDELVPLVPAEAADLRQGDVPLFTRRIDGTDLRDSRGHIIEGYFEGTVLRAALDGLARLDDRHCEEQVDLIDKSMLLLDAPRTRAAQPVQRAHPRKVADTGSASYLEAAVRVGEELKGDAILGQDDVSWVSVTLRSEELWQWVVAPVNETLYDGLPGLGLFFAQLGAVTGRSDFEDLGRRTTGPILAYLHSDPGPGNADIGGLAGRPAALHTLANMAATWGDRELLTNALEGVERFADRIHLDRGLDLLSGAAGCLLICLDLHRATGREDLLEVARRCGERLHETAEPQERGVGWTPAAASEPLAGFSHGACGIALALLRLAEATGEERHRDLAHRALEFERSLFLPEVGNWMDRRRFEDAPDDFRTLAWCHGSPGVALGRLLMLPLLDDPQIEAEIRIAVDATLEGGFGGNHSLCHGDLGNLEILLTAAERLGEGTWRRRALEHATRARDEVLAGEWRCGLPNHTEAPGLMTGLAGIGYGLLRLAAPDTVPQVLRLELSPELHRWAGVGEMATEADR